MLFSKFLAWNLHFWSWWLTNWWTDADGRWHHLTQMRERKRRRNSPRIYCYSPSPQSSLDCINRASKTTTRSITLSRVFCYRHHHHSFINPFSRILPPPSPPYHHHHSTTRSLTLSLEFCLSFIMRFSKCLPVYNSLLLLSVCLSVYLSVYPSICLSVWVGSCNGSFKKKVFMKVKGNWTEKWRWLRRELKIWYMCNCIVVNIFTKKCYC